MSVRESCEPVMLLGATRRQRLAQLLKQAMDEWRQQWGGGSHVTFEVEIADALCRKPALNSGRAFAFSAAVGEDRLLTIAVPMEAQYELLGIPAPRSVVDGGAETASAVIGEALSALCLRLTRAKAATGVSVAPVSLEKMSQAWGHYGLTVTVKTAGERILLRARLFPELLAAMLPSPATRPTEPLASRRSAIGVEAVAVNAWLGEAEVSLGELASLQVGDVILLEASLSGTGRLALPDGRELAQIRLGSAAGHRAVTVVGKTAGLPSRSV